MMPQLDFSTYPSQLFWLAVNFAILYFLMAKLALPRIGKTIENRAAAIKADLDRAASLKIEGEALLQNHEKIILEAQNRARYVIKQAQDEIAAESAKQLSALQDKLDKRARDAETKLHAAKTKVLAEIQPMSQELAQSMVKKLLGAIENDNGHYLERQKKEARG